MSHIFANIIVVFLNGLDLRSYILSTNRKLYCIIVGISCVPNGLVLLPANT